LPGFIPCQLLGLQVPIPGIPLLYGVPKAGITSKKIVFDQVHKIFETISSCHFYQAYFGK
jgi:hypothetical protein